MSARGVVAALAAVVMGATAASAGAATPTVGPPGVVQTSAAVHRLAERNADVRTALRFYVPFQTGRTAPYADLLAPTWRDVPRNPGQGPGISGFRAFVTGFGATFSDLRFRIEQVVASGGTVVVRSTATGRQTGPFLGLPASGRAVRFRTVDLHEVRGGRIVVSHHLEDLLGLAGQIGGAVTPGA